MDEVTMKYENLRNSYDLFLELIFEFPDEGEDEEEDEDEGEDEETSNADKRKAFWKSQEELLQATLFRATTFEAKIRRATMDVLRELDSVGCVRCSCRKTVAVVGCRNCRQKEVAIQLQNAGFNCVICKSNWKSSPEIPAGQHTYLEVVQHTTGSKKGEMKVIIELNFRAEFEMARASPEYNHLIEKLPEVFVGKSERLRNLVNILCDASKKCMKERRMHLPPWRKHKYMQAKWRGTPLRQAAPPVVAVEPPMAPPKQRVSMLTFDFLENPPIILYQRNKAVKVN